MKDTEWEQELRQVAEFLRDDHHEAQAERMDALADYFKSRAIASKMIEARRKQTLNPGATP